MEKTSAKVPRRVPMWMRSVVAVTALLDEGLTVAQVGAGVGYPEPSVFTRVFRRWTGMTPRQFREQGTLKED